MCGCPPALQHARAPSQVSVSTCVAVGPSSPLDPGHYALSRRPILIVCVDRRAAVYICRYRIRFRVTRVSRGGVRVVTATLGPSQR